MNRPVDEVAVQARVAQFAARSIKTDSKTAALRQVVRMIDLTTLEGADSPGRVARLCAKAQRPWAEDPDLRVAAVCLYPNLIAQAKQLLAGSDVQLAAVATGFPAGQVDLDIRLADTRQAVEAGADEIDMVISRGAWLAGRRGQVAEEIAAVKAACGQAHLKVILETGELGSLDEVRKASLLAMHSGADFVKTSTGKIPAAASPAVTYVMLEAVRDYYYETGRLVGVKPAGGITTAKQAIAYLVMLTELMPEEWMSPELFRFGASSLLDDVLRQLSKQESGAYEGRVYVPLG